MAEKENHQIHKKIMFKDQYVYGKFIQKLCLCIAKNTKYENVYSLWGIETILVNINGLRLVQNQKKK